MVIMNRIDAKFNELKKRNARAFIAYLTVGFPDLETNLKLALEMEKRGVDLIELGIPFSDPIADGPTIQASSQASLDRGITPDDALILSSEIRKYSSIPLILMGYLNPFIHKFPHIQAKKMARAGVDGIIIPDLPPEASDFIRLPLKKAGIHTIFLLAPTSQKNRIQLIGEKCGGFVYYVSRTGVTGTREKLSRELEQKVKEIKKFTALPVCVGFGISTHEQLLRVWETADGAIVGSALIKPFLGAETKERGLKSCLKVLNDLIGKN